MAPSAAASRRRPPLAPIEAPPPPSFFQNPFICPISLEVMRSPVSLSTGVTYDRSSIQQWLDSGHRTCPATRLPLSSTDLVPNLTLRRLIRTYSLPSSPHRPAAIPVSRALNSFEDPVPLLRDFAASIQSGADVLDDGELAAALMSLIERRGVHSEAAEAAVAVLAMILSTKNAVDALAADSDRSSAMLVSFLADGRSAAARIAAAGVLEVILSAPACDGTVADRPELVPELVRLINETAADAGIRCIAALLRRSRRPVLPIAIVRAGAIKAITRALNGKDLTATAAEKGIWSLAELSRCGDSRAAMSSEAAAVVTAVISWITKVGTLGKEAAVVVLWAICCCNGGDARAREAIAKETEATWKLLLVMQGERSPEMVKMAGELFRAIRTEQNKSGLPHLVFDSKTIHNFLY